MASSLETPTRTTYFPEPDPPDESEGEGAAWGMLWILLGFKVFSIGLILWLHTSHVSLTMMFFLNWPWFALMVGMVALFGLAWFRLFRGRLKRRALLRAEWHVAEDEYNEERKVS